MIKKYKNLRDISKLSFKEYPEKIKQKIRDHAVDRADKHMIVYGIDLNEIKIDEYEHYVHIEEQKILKELKKKSLSVILMLTLGVSF